MWATGSYRHRVRGSVSAKAAILSVAWLILSIQGAVGPSLAQTPSVARDEVVASSAHVTVRSDPSGQAIIVDGSRQQASTPAVLDLGPGQYTISIEASGYEPLEHDLTLGSGQRFSLMFVLLKTPPVQPSPAELMAKTRQSDTTPIDPNGPGSAEQRRYVAMIQAENDACAECHSEIKSIQSKGLHNTLRCSECHGDYDKHTKDEDEIGPIEVPRGGGVQVLCEACHTRDKSNSRTAHMTKVDMPEHLEEKRVRLDNLCEQCHHVHAPQKWVFESREIAGLPQLARSLPPLNEEIAEQTKEQFTTATEIFAVVPLSLGLIGYLAFRNNEDYPSQELTLAGLALVGGTWLLGKVFYRRHVESIRQINIERAAANDRAQEYNTRLERELANYYTEVARWSLEAEGRGIVVVQ
jgi:hypothetical protein